MASFMEKAAYYHVLVCFSSKSVHVCQFVSTQGFLELDFGSDLPVLDYCCF